MKVILTSFLVNPRDLIHTAVLAWACPKHFWTVNEVQMRYPEVAGAMPRGKRHTGVVMQINSFFAQNSSDKVVGWNSTN